MKKLFLVIAFLITAYSVYSQGFTFTRISPETITITPSDTLNRTNIQSLALLRPNSGTLQIRIIRTIEDLTIGWDTLGTSICTHIGCYAPAVDTVIESFTTNADDDTIKAYFYVRSFYAPYFIHGAGHLRFRAELVSNPSQFLELDFRANTFQTIGIHQLSTIVKEFSLGQNYPNPFNPATKIIFSIPKSDYVSLRVYDILGREVKVLVSENLTHGEYEVDFDAKGLSSGMYYYSLRAGEYVSVKKMVLVK